MKISEVVELKKNQWQAILSRADKQELGGDLVNLVRHAYSATPDGSFVNSVKDVLPSDWMVLDWDDEPDVDACIFYRKPRANESWRGYKIQGLGHDGHSLSKSKAVKEIQVMLHKNGTWIESSDAMRTVLKKLNVPSVKDVNVLRQLFNDPKLEMVGPDKYARELPNGQVVIETVFGFPKLK